MSNLDYFTELGIDKTLKPVSIAHKEISQEEYFKLTISPSFPQIPEFNPNQYIYASLSENSISVIARHNTQEMFYQAGFVMDRDIEDGTYELQGGERQQSASPLHHTGQFQSGSFRTKWPDHAEAKQSRQNNRSNIRI